MFDFLYSLLKIATAATDTVSGLSTSIAGFVLVVIVTGLIFWGVSSAEPKIKPPPGMTKAG